MDRDGDNFILWGEYKQQLRAFEEDATPEEFARLVRFLKYENVFPDFWNHFVDELRDTKARKKHLRALVVLSRVLVMYPTQAGRDMNVVLFVAVRVVLHLKDDVMKHYKNDMLDLFLAYRTQPGVGAYVVTVLRFMERFPPNRVKPLLETLLSAPYGVAYLACVR